MKNLSKIFICLILCVFTLGLVSCGKKDEHPHPTSQEITYSNGGLAVRKGDFLYFVNGYQSANDLNMEDANREDKFTVGALMMAKLDAHGNPILNADGRLDDQNCWVISDSLCGFEATGLYVFGDYLYFTGSCLREEIPEIGGWANKRVLFYRVKLDGSNKVEELYESQTYNDNLEYSFYSNGSSTFLVVYEKGTLLGQEDEETPKANRLIRIDVGGKKAGKPVEVATDIESGNLLLPDARVANAYENIYYLTSSDGKYTINRLNAITGDVNSSFHVETRQITLKAVVSGYVFFEMDTNPNVQAGKTLYYCDASGNANACWKGSDLYSFYFTLDGSTIVATRDDKVYCAYAWHDNLTSEGCMSKVILTETGINVIGFTRSKLVYYNSDNEVKAIAFPNAFSFGAEAELIAKLEDADMESFDIGADDEYIYYYKTSNSNKYLHRLKVENNNGAAEQMIGIYLEADIPSADEETKEED